MKTVGVYLFLKDLAKMALQHLVFPVAYRLYRRGSADEGSVLFADAHNSALPFSMEEMYRAVTARGYRVQVFCADFSEISFSEKVRFCLSFLKAYANAGTLFLCDYFLPAASCNKRPETRVVQLWHGCGTFKKFGYDAEDDISGIYRGNPCKNTDFVTVSAPVCIRAYETALGLPRERIIPTGVSRTDAYFRADIAAENRRRFFEQYPEAAGKKIVLWAPTFRGNAGDFHNDYTAVQLQQAEELSAALGDAYHVVLKLHPHREKQRTDTPCCLRTEELLPVADVMITDYSSILYEFMLLRKPVVLYGADLSDYAKSRGFYMDYDTIPAVHVTDPALLPAAVCRAAEHPDVLPFRETGRDDSPLFTAEDRAAFLQTYMSACDGHATERILDLLFPDRERSSNTNHSREVTL